MVEEDVVLSGTVEDVIFQNAENGYAVFSIQTEEDDDVVCVGTVPQLHDGETLRVTGSYVLHPTYGRQLRVEFFEREVPSTEAGMEKYLASGVIKGIGPKTAKKIVKRFGLNTFTVIEDNPDRLCEIKGITYEKAMAIHTVFTEQHQLREVMVFLQQYGISPVYATKIYKKYKARTYDIVKNNPYQLAEDIFGIGFKMADRLAANTGISADSPNRIKAGIKFVLNQAVAAGHVYLPAAELAEKASALLSVAVEVVHNTILELQMEHAVWAETVRGEAICYLNAYYYAEMAVAKKLLEIATDYEGQNASHIDREIEKTEQKTGIKLAENQRRAVTEAMTNGFLIITGGPGTGKTTIINTIIRLLRDEDVDIVLAAPTGRAAKRMTEATGREAQTIHRLLGIGFVGEDVRRQTFDKNEDNPIDADVVIIDESSMVDILLMHALLRAVAPGTRLIMVGDVDQLPSVGAGNVLKDMIRSGRLPVVRLREIFRQAQESAIVMNAHRINEGVEPVLNEKDRDFFFLRRAYVEEVVAAVVSLVTKRLPGFANCDAKADIQILTPMRKSPIGVMNLNQVLQMALNPPAEDKQEKEFRNIVFREGDKVMQIKNNYNMVWKIYNALGKRTDEGVGVFNGDEGVIVQIDQEAELLRVHFDDNKTVDYDFTQLDELELAYAITIHKSQGSEYPVVIVPIYSGPPMLLNRNLLYTAVTRAKKLVVLVGLTETMKKMIDNNKEIDRYSSLDYRIGVLAELQEEFER